MSYSSFLRRKSLKIAQKRDRVDFRPGVRQNTDMTGQTQSQHIDDRDHRMTEIAQRVGIHKSHMSRIMNGKGTPSLDVAARIAREMGVTLDEFYLRLNERTEAEVAVA